MSTQSTLSKGSKNQTLCFGACSVIVSCLRELRKGDGKVSSIRAAWDIPSAMAFSVSDLSSTCDLSFGPVSRKQMTAVHIKQWHCLSLDSKIFRVS